MTDDQTQIQVPIDLMLQRYAAELSEMTQRALTAESQVVVLQHQVAMQQQMLESQAPQANPDSAAAPPA